jgi:aspartyl/asparaginyl-tRNA synthetase
MSSCFIFVCFVVYALQRLEIGCSVVAHGKLVTSPGREKVEIQANKIDVVGQCDPMVMRCELCCR